MYERRRPMRSNARASDYAEMVYACLQKHVHSCSTPVHVDVSENLTDVSDNLAEQL